MNCLDLDSLIRHVHGEQTNGEAGIAERHLAGCARCREEARVIEALEAGLRAVVQARKDVGRVGSDCLSADSFAAYIERGLTETERASVERHLVGCPACREELASSLDRLSTVADSLRSTPAYLLARAMELGKATQARSPQTEEEANFLEIVVRSVKGAFELVWTSGQLVLAPPALPVRGAPGRAEARTVEVEKKMGRFGVAVEMEQLDDSLCQIIVRVKEGPKRADGIRVSLLSGNREQASFVTRQGEVMFDQVPFGAYHVTVYEAGSPVGKIRLKVEGSRHE